MPAHSTNSKIRAKKRFGQNFLIDQSIVEEIFGAADVSKEDSVLEIGPGKGVLTERLAELAKDVTAVEIDRDLAAILNTEFILNDNVTIVSGDVLKIDLTEIMGDKPFKVVANLPYYITTPILMMLLESSLNVERIVVMVQKEVALRMCAKNGTPDYGALSLAVSYRSNPRIVVEVPGECFRPVPKVDSAVVCLDILAPRLSQNEENLLFSIIKAVFSKRRKTLVNGVSSGGIMDKAVCEQILENLGFEKNIRGEKLSLEDYIAFTKEFIRIRKS